MGAIRIVFFLIFLGIFSCSQKSGEYDDNGENPKTLPEESTEDTATVKEVSVKKLGVKIEREGAVPAHTLPALMQKQDSLNIKLRGKVVEVCQKKGCWMTIDLENGSLVRVTFRDYGFFIPKDADGKQAIIKGTAKKEVTDVATLKHYAKDAGKSPEEIASIDAPKENLVFIADGVIIEEEDE